MDLTTRRDFLERSGTALGGAWLARLAPLIAAAQACASDAMEQGLAFTILTPREGADLEALSARIVPTDETPGAREAGCVYFADHALGSFFADLLPIVRPGLQALHERAVAADAGAGSFAALSEARQDEIIAAVEQEDPGFFFFAKTLILVGLVANPEHGGNRNGVGWELIGFEPAYAHQPPFGYYDRNEHGAVSDGAAEGADR